MSMRNIVTMSSTSKPPNDAYVCVLYTLYTINGMAKSKSIREFLVENRREKELRHSFGISIGFVWFSFHPSLFHAFSVIMGQRFSVSFSPSITNLHQYISNCSANTCNHTYKIANWMFCFFDFFFWENSKLKFCFTILLCVCVYFFRKLVGGLHFINI